MIDTDLTGTRKCCYGRPRRRCGPRGRPDHRDVVHERQAPTPGPAYDAASKWASSARSVAGAGTHGQLCDGQRHLHDQHPDEPQRVRLSEVPPDSRAPNLDRVLRDFVSTNQIPVSWIEPYDIPHMIVFLASAEAHYVTGSAMEINCG